jgi:hypothetical protein
MNDNDNGNTTTHPKTGKVLRFESRRDIVYDNLRRMICKAKSVNFARRIANALNEYQPDRRGQ